MAKTKLTYRRDNGGFRKGFNHQIAGVSIAISTLPLVDTMKWWFKALDGTKKSITWTGSGDIDVDNLDGDLNANTGSGRIEIADSKGNLDVNTGSGDIRLNRITGALGVNVGSGDITASELNITGYSSFNSGSGDTEVVLASVLNHDISVNSGSGDAVLDFNGNKIEGEIVMKASKRNGRIEAPFSFDKEYEEDKGKQVIMIKEAKIGNKDIRIRVSTGSGTARIIK